MWLISGKPHLIILLGRPDTWKQSLSQVLLEKKAIFMDHKTETLC